MLHSVGFKRTPKDHVSFVFLEGNWTWSWAAGRESMATALVAGMSTDNQDAYVTTLDAEYLAAVKESLDEDDNLRNETVQTMRQWISQQPHFNCRTGKLKTCPTCLWRTLEFHWNSFNFHLFDPMIQTHISWWLSPADASTTWRKWRTNSRCSSRSRLVCRNSSPDGTRWGRKCSLLCKSGQFYIPFSYFWTRLVTSWHLSHLSWSNNSLTYRPSV